MIGWFEFKLTSNTRNTDLGCKSNTQQRVLSMGLLRPEFKRNTSTMDSLS